MQMLIDAMARVRNGCCLVVFVSVAAVVGAGCLSAGGFETARAVPAGQTQETAAFGVATTSGTRHDYWLRADNGEFSNARNQHAPLFAAQLEYLVRWSSGVGMGFEYDLGVHNLFIHPFGYGGGLSLGAKQQLWGGDDGPFALALGLRVLGHSSATGGGTSDARYISVGQLESRLVASFHQEGWTGIVAPKFVVEGVYDVLDHSTGKFSASAAGYLAGASLGVASEYKRAEHFLELTALVGGRSRPWRGDVFALPASTHHVRAMLGYGVRR